MNDLRSAPARSGRLRSSLGVSALLATLFGCGSNATGRRASANEEAAPPVASDALDTPAINSPSSSPANSPSSSPANSPSSSPASETARAQAPSDRANPEGNCLWEIDALLTHAGVPLSDRLDCGSLPAPPQAKLDCLRRAAAAGQSAEFTINNCVDCSILSTYVSTPVGEYRIYRESDIYGDSIREVRIESCDEITEITEISDDDGLYRPSCEGASLLYSCLEARR